MLAAGFDNTHDWLIHLKTGESKEVIAARKHTFPWGAWLEHTAIVRSRVHSPKPADDSGVEEGEGEAGSLDPNVGKEGLDERQQGLGNGRWEDAELADVDVANTKVAENNVAGVPEVRLS